MAYNPNFTPWQGFSSGPGGQDNPTFSRFQETPDQELLRQSYDAQQSLTAIQKAARLKKLKDLNDRLKMFGQSPGGNGVAALAMANGAGGYNPASPLTAGFGMPVPGAGGIRPGQPVTWTPPLTAEQQLGKMRPLTGAATDPYARFSPDGTVAPEATAQANPRASALNDILKQISDDERQSLQDSKFTMLEPQLSTQGKLNRDTQHQYDAAYAKARGEQDAGASRLRQQQTVNVGGGGYSGGATGGGGGGGPVATPNAVLTDNRVRANNDTKLAEQLIANGGISTQAQLRDMFPDADWNRLGALLTATQQQPARDYETEQSSASLANKSLQAMIQKASDTQAEKALREGEAKLGPLDAWQIRNTPSIPGVVPSVPYPTGYGKDDNGVQQYSPEHQALIDEYNASAFLPQADMSSEQIQGAMKGLQREVQYDPGSGTFVPIMRRPDDPSVNPPGYISRQDMPGQNFHTDLPRSPQYNGLPIVQNMAEYNTLPPGAQAVTNDGRVLPPKGGYRPGVRTYGQPQASDEFGPAFDEAGYGAGPAPRARQAPLDPNAHANFGQEADPAVGNRVNFFTPTNRPEEKNLVDFGKGSIPAPRRGVDGIPIIDDPRQLQWLNGGSFRYNGRLYSR